MKKAFSLIELSIVILIIGILIAGVTQSSRLVGQFRLTTAKELTENSAVNSITNLASWWETTSDNSFSPSPNDQDPITVWNDINPQSVDKNNATAPSGNQPIYIANGINYLPVLRFNGSNQFFNIDGSVITGGGYTIFVVERRRSAAAGAMFIGSTAPNATNSKFSIGYAPAQNQIYFDQYNNTYIGSVAGYTSPTTKIHSFVFSTINPRTYYSNGSSVVLSPSGGVSNSPLVTNNNATIGNMDNSTYYNGDIAEIILFAKTLKTEERQAVEKYLGKKWGVKVATSN